MALGILGSTGQSVPAVSLPFLDSFGLSISNNADSPNTVIDIGAGQIKDLTNTINMSIGSTTISTFDPVVGLPTNTPLLLNAATNGVNGLDQGSLQANKVYYISLIGDSHGNNPTASLLSLDINTSYPLIPAGYDCFRLFNYAITDASSHFLLFNCIGTGHFKQWLYDTPQATSVVSGTDTSYTFVELTSMVPAQQIGTSGTPVYLEVTLVPNAAGDTVKLQPANGTGDAITIVGNVAGQPTRQYVYVVCQYQADSELISGINYKVSDASAVATIKVAGFNFG